MYTNALVLMICGLFTMAIHNITQRYILDPKRAILSTKAVLISQHGISILFLAIAILWWPDFGSVQTRMTIFIVAIIGTSFFNIFIQYANTKSKQLADTSLTTPIQAMTPMLVTLLAFTLNEIPSLQGIFGIFLISFGVFIHLRVGYTDKWYLPFVRFIFLPNNINQLAIKEKERIINEQKALRWAYLSAFCGTFGLLFDGLVVRNGNVVFGFMIQAIILTSVFSLMVKPKNDNTSTKSVTKKVKIHASLALGVLYGLHILFIMTAMRFSPVAYIGSLKRFYIIVVAFMSYVVLKEKMAKKRIIPAIIIFIGAVLIALDDTAGRMIGNIDYFLQTFF